MSNYGPNQSAVVEKFEIEIYPYLAVPDNIFETGAGLQYGADFQVSFSRQGTHTNNIGLVQLIFPQTVIFTGVTQIGKWNVDKRASANTTPLLGNCLYSTDGVTVGTHSEYYVTKSTRSISPNKCTLIDTPREIKSGFSAKGAFSGITITKFANYVVELDGKDGKIFNTGLSWWYEVVQDPRKLTTMSLRVSAPMRCLLTDNAAHIKALVKFLNATTPAPAVPATEKSIRALVT